MYKKILVLGFHFSWLFVGTTGKPKGVVISHTALIVQSLAKVAIVGYSEDDVRLSSRNMYICFDYN